jgi:hypothetical protein
MFAIETLPYQYFDKQTAYRLIPSKYPPKSLFDDVATHAEFEILYAVQELTNPRIRNELGSLNRVPANERPYGIRGCNYALGPFVHLNPAGSRFSRGDFGVYYAADDVQTAIAETRYHQEHYFSGVQGLKYDRLSMRCLKTQFTAQLRDITAESLLTQPWYDSADYASAQALGAALYKQGDAGLVYQSVRASAHRCFALFTPQVITDVIQTEHYEYVWNGQKIEIALATSEVL